MHPRMVKEKVLYEKWDFIMKKNAPQARLIKKNALQAKYFDQVLMGTPSYWHSMYIIFHKSQLRIFPF